MCFYMRVTCANSCSAIPIGPVRPPEQSALFSFLRGSEPDREQKNRPIGPSKVATGRPNRPIRCTDACSVPDPAYKVTASTQLLMALVHSSNREKSPLSDLAATRLKIILSTTGWEHVHKLTYVWCWYPNCGITYS
jgi:hypothetical protein